MIVCHFGLLNRFLVIVFNLKLDVSMFDSHPSLKSSLIIYAGDKGIV